MVISEQDLNVSCGPQPVAPVPSSQIPQELPTKENLVKQQPSKQKQFSRTSSVMPSQHAMLTTEALGQGELIYENEFFRLNREGWRAIRE